MTKTILLKNCSSQDLVKRTPSTSAIYETLRRWNDHHISYHHQSQISLQLSFHLLVVFRSKELRESLSRPSSRLSCENGMEKMGKDVVRIVIEIIIEMNVVDNCNHPDYNGNDQGKAAYMTKSVCSSSARCHSHVSTSPPGPGRPMSDETNFSPLSSS